MERVVAYSPDDAEIWKEREPRYRVELDKRFRPFERGDFEGHDISSPEFYIGLSFTLEHFGVGNICYTRDRLLGFNPRWAQEKAGTPLGPATLSYQFSLGPEPQGAIIPPLELVVSLHGRTDRFPPDQLLEFSSHGRAILGRWERRIHDPDLHPLPLVIPRKFILPEWKEVRTVYLPEDPKILSDLRVTFLATEPKTANEAV